MSSNSARRGWFPQCEFSILFIAAFQILLTCKLATPDNFLDKFAGDLTLGNLKNVASGNAGELSSGVIIGTLTGGGVVVKVSLDDGAYKTATLSGTTWKIFVPTGAAAAAGKNRWQVGSKHRLKVRAYDNLGNTKGDLINVTFVKQQNRDVNGDGYADIVSGAQSNDGNAAAGGQSAGAGNKGAAYVFYGSSSSVTNHPENATAYFCSGPPDCSVIENPDNIGGYFGSAVAIAGDVNGDGYADVVVGAADNNGASSAGGQTAGAGSKGAAYVFYGSGTGVTNHPENATAYFCSGPPDCSVIANPDNFGGYFAYSGVTFAGDLNGDGFDDVAIGAIYNDGTSASGGQTTGTTNKGAAYVFYGSATGVTNHPESNAAYFCSGAPDCSVIQNPDNDPGLFGASLSSAGDVNADGYADLIVGAASNTGTTAAGGQTGAIGSKGAAYVFYGSASGLTNHPENAIAYFCAGPPDCSVLENPDENGGSFGTSVAYAGDINTDGYADIVVGASVNDGNGAAGGQVGSGNTHGAAYVFYGSATGVTNHPENATAYFCSGPPDCSVVANPDITDGYFGTSVAFAGDVNGDGYSDTIIGAGSNNGFGAAGAQSLGISGKGAAYIFYGSASGLTNHPEMNTAYFCAGAPDCSVIQNPDNDGGGFGNKVSLAGDVNGDGYPDVVIGAHQNNGATAAGGQTAGAGSKGATYIFYGASNGVTNHPENATPYFCAGPPDCSVIENPDNTSGNFGKSVGWLWDFNKDKQDIFIDDGSFPQNRLRIFATQQYALAQRRDESLG